MSKLIITATIHLTEEDKADMKAADVTPQIIAEYFKGLFPVATDVVVNEIPDEDHINKMAE